MEIKKENITHSPVEVCLYLSACSLRDTPPAKWEKDSGLGVTFPEKSLVKVPPPRMPSEPPFPSVTSHGDREPVRLSLPQQPFMTSFSP